MKPEPMTHAERFRALMRFQPVDRLPRVEWAIWWDQTIERWEREGLHLSASYRERGHRLELAAEISRHFGLDVYRQHIFHPWTGRQPQPTRHGGGILVDARGYDAMRGELHPSNAWLHWAWERLAAYQAEMERGESLLWLTVTGFFAWPRRLFGIENHFYAFYDEPDLLHRMNHDQAEFIIRVLREAVRHCRPVFVTIGEDMSFNSGPMLSRPLFEEFLAPYYRRVVPVMKELGLFVFVDTDGDATDLIPWLRDVGVEGLLPMERAAGSDAVAARRAHPDFLMVGNFEKLRMAAGEEAVRHEFERLRPVMESGGFIPSPDHQTPPQVSLEQYRTWLRVLHEYAATAVPG